MSRSATRNRVGKNPEYLAWLHTQPCIVTGELPVTVHHVRRFGSIRDDLRGVPLVARLHMLTHEVPGFPCVERGKRIFEACWGVDLEAEIGRLQTNFDLQRNVV